MMRLSVLLVGVVILVIVCIAQSFGAVSFVHEKTFTVPGVSVVGQSLVFTADYPGDNSVLLAFDSAHAVLYSVTHDSILQQFLPDSGFTFAAATFADANRDSVLDVILASYQTGDPNLYPASLRWQIRAYIDPNDFSSLRNDTFSVDGSGACFLSGTKFAANEPPRILFSYQTISLQWVFGMWLWEYDDGATRVYDDFPSHYDSTATFITNISPITVADPQPRLIASTYNYWYQEISGPDTYYWSAQIGSLSAPDSISPFGFGTDPYGSADCGSYGNGYLHSYACGGGIFSSTESDIVVGHSYTFTCHQGWNIADSSYSFHRLECWSLAGGTLSSLRWSRDLLNADYSNFTYHPLLPGYFFAFSGDTLLLFRGSDGSIRDSITVSVPAGEKHWDYPYNDSIPRLIVVNGNTVSLYHLDIATGVEDNQHAEIVPTHPTLSDPYPNPFNPNTTLSISSVTGGRATLEVLNIRGQRVAMLYDGAIGSNKTLTFVWNAFGHASGICFARAKTPDGELVKKMLLLK